MAVILTRRLELRPLAESDLMQLHELYRSEELMRYVTGRVRTVAETEERLQSTIEDHVRYGFGLYATQLRRDGKWVGRCGITPCPTDRGLDGDLAWMIKKEFWGQGLASEVAAALLDFGRRELPTVRLFATAEHGNLASIAIMKKMGMRLVSATDRAVEYEVVPPY